MWKEFKEFAVRGSVVDMTVGITVGAAFGAIAKSLVVDLLMPPVGIALGGADFTDLFVVLKQGATSGPYASLALAEKAGAVTVNYGRFLNTLVAFLVVALAVFLLVRAVNRLRRKKKAQPEPVPPMEKECPYCLSRIPLGAVRCAFCTSEILLAEKEG